MSKLAFAKSFRELTVYHKARQLQREIFQISKKFPRDETFSLTDQIRRSSRSIGANIAEAWAKRRYPNHFLSKITDADGEQFETQHWIGTALECKYIDLPQAKLLMENCLEVGKMLGSMMDKVDIFCGEEYRVSREASAEYFTNCCYALECHFDEQSEEKSPLFARFLASLEMTLRKMSY